MTVVMQLMLGLFKDCCNWFLLKKYMNGQYVFTSFVIHHFTVVEMNVFGSYVFETYHVCYTILLTYRFSIHFSVFRRNLNNFFKGLAQNLFLADFQCSWSYTMWYYIINDFLHSAISLSVFTVFLGPGFSGSRFFRVQVFQDLGPWSRSRTGFWF